ncbi:MAG: hypothetical protein LBP86_00170 [Azoarcus sp.]|jgi:hypothetical protein|nr:hypothetical protein [Azoarcus sp.]
MKKAFQQIAGAWNRFSGAERHQLVGATCFVLALFYGLLIWYPSHKHLGELVYKEQKKQRARQASSRGASADLQKFNFDGLNVQATRQELAKVRMSLATLEAERARLLARFVPLDDLETLQALKSELARLAESGDMEVTALEHIYRTPSDRNRPPTPELLKKAGEGNRYKRPLLSLKARASYRGLMAFLDGLPQLSRVATPVWSNIQVRGSARPRETRSHDVLGMSSASGAAPKQWLEVEIRLAI